MTDKRKNHEADGELEKPSDEGTLVGGDAAAAAYRRQADEPVESRETASREGEDKPESEKPDAERIAELTDLLQRKVAEFDNYRKRVQREQQEFAGRATEALIEQLLPVLDSLELALNSGGGDADSYRRGVELIHKQLLELLSRHGVETIDAVGAQFDPNFHEAIDHVPSADHPEGEIIGEIQRGYTLGGRVLRPSRVRVAGPPEREPEEESEGSAEIPIQ